MRLSETTKENHELLEAGVADLAKMEDELFSLTAHSLIRGGGLRNVRVKPKKSIEGDVAKYCTTEFIIHTDDKDTIFMWDETENKFIDAESKLKTHIHSLMPYLAGTSFLREVLERIRNETRVSLEEVDPPNFILLKNGIYDLRQRKFIHSANPEFKDYLYKYLFTSRIDAEYNPEIKECPAIDAFFRQVVREENVQLLYEIVGYCLLSGYPIHALFILHGSGANGKSTYLNLLQKFLGENNVSNASMQALTEDKFVFSTLYGKKANIFADLPKEAIKEFGLIKALTGNDGVVGQHKFKKPFTFINSAKLIFACNQIPAVYDETDALYRRLIIVDFPNSFEGDKADINLLEKLTTKEELSGLLYRAIESLYSILEKGFTYAASKEERKEMFLMKSDSVRAFVQKCVEKGGADDEIDKEDIFSCYKAFCEKYRLNSVESSLFFKKFRRFVEFEFHEVRKIVNGKRKRLFSGVSIAEYRPEIKQSNLFEYSDDVKERLWGD